jgi:hypothetical protein
VSTTSGSSVTAVGPATTGTAVPMITPWKPYLQLNGTTLTVKLPTQAPAGATGWQLTVGSTTRTLPLWATSSEFAGLSRGVATPWSLRATAGDWNGKLATSLPATGTVTP